MSSSSGSAGIIMAFLSFTNFTTFSCTTVSVLITGVSLVVALSTIVSLDAISFSEAAVSPAGFFIFAGCLFNVPQHRRRFPAPQETDRRYVQSLSCVVHGSTSPGGVACDLVTDISFPSTHHLGFAYHGPVVLRHAFEQHGFAVLTVCSARALKDKPQAHHLPQLPSQHMHVKVLVAPFLLWSIFEKGMCRETVLVR